MRLVVNLNLPLAKEEGREVIGEGETDFVPQIHMYQPQLNSNTRMDNINELVCNLDAIEFGGICESMNTKSWLTIVKQGREYFRQ